MKRAMFGSMWLMVGLALLLCWTSPAFGDTQFEITGGNPAYGSNNGFLTAAYTTNNVPVGPVVCNDLADEVGVNTEHWYTVESFSSLLGSAGTGNPSASGIWKGTSYGSYGSYDLYAQVAYLTEKIFAGQGNLQQETWAIWAIFDPGTASTPGTAKYYLTGISGACAAIYGTSDCSSVAAGSILADAEANALNNVSAYNNLVVYDPKASGQNFNGGATCGTAGNCDSQEFFGEVPDGGMTLMLLGGGLVSLGSLRRKFRA